jgi:hypothetical protein
MMDDGMLALFNTDALNPQPGAFDDNRMSDCADE